MCRQAVMLSVAQRVAQGSEHDHYRLGAIITRGNRIISVGWNKNKTHPRQLPYLKEGKQVTTKSVHAELDAIIGVPVHLLRGSTIYVARILANGSTGLAKPCASCRKIIEAANIKKIVYTTNTGYTEEYP